MMWQKMDDTASYSNTLVWLKDFYGRFEADATRLYAREPLWRVCRNCPDGYCCSRPTYIARTRAFNPYLYEDWRLMLEYIRDNFSTIDKKRLAEHISSPEKKCIFLYDRRCRIHPVRSWTSRVHPYTVSFHPGSRFFATSSMELPSCPAMAEKFGVSPGELRIKKVEPLSRDLEANLVRVKIKKSKPLWVIDASAYVREYEGHIPLQKSLMDFQSLFKLAWAAGGEQGELLSTYVAEAFRG